MHEGGLLVLQNFNQMWGVDLLGMLPLGLATTLVMYNFTADMRVVARPMTSWLNFHENNGTLFLGSRNGQDMSFSLRLILGHEDLFMPNHMLIIYHDAHNW